MNPESVQERIIKAAREFEAALNLLPNQIEVEVEAIDISSISHGPDRRYTVRVISTHPVQLYP